MRQKSVINWDEYKKAYKFLSFRDDSAFYYFNKVTGNSKDSLQIAMAFNNMAVIQSSAGDYYGAQESLSSSLKFLNEKNNKDRSCLANDFNELGMTSTNLKSYTQAIDFYNKSIAFSNDPSFKPVILNNEANAYQKNKNYFQALKLYKQIIALTPSTGTAYARILTNRATAEWHYNKHFNPAPDLIKALNIRLSKKDLWGQNSSYAHLADFYFRSNPDSAFFFASQMYTIAKKINSPDDQLEALQKLINLGPPREAKLFFERFQVLNDSLQTARNAAKNQFALIRYEAEKNKAENLKLQKNNAEENYQLTKQRVLISLILLIVLIAVTYAFFWYRKRRQRQAQETKDAVLENQKKTSKKVHDTLANDIYRVMKRIEYDAVLDTTWLLNSIDDIYQRARDISYEIMLDSDEYFREKISELLTSFASETIKVVLTGNNEALWQRVNTIQKGELKYILQELMVNMQKHSGAKNVVIKFEQQADRCLITYFDDGTGFPDNMLPKNGLTNTGNRIKAMQGEINFETGANKGLEIKISFPIA